jgi:transcriptional regulator with XRE-family HTH domain
MDDLRSFGEYIRARRESLGRTLRGAAAELDIAPAYLSDIEKGNRPAPPKHLEAMLRLLAIPDGEAARFYDLAGKSKNTISPDLVGYVSKSELARVALRRARDRNISDEQWQRFIDAIDESGGQA